MVSILKGDKWIADIQEEKTQIENVLDLKCFNNLGYSYPKMSEPMAELDMLQIYIYIYVYIYLNHLLYFWNIIDQLYIPIKNKD